MLFNFGVQILEIFANLIARILGNNFFERFARELLLKVDFFGPDSRFDSVIDAFEEDLKNKSRF